MFCVWQPLPCPFCDRIFKQDGRLKEHLKNKHADEENQESAVSAESNQTEQAPASTSEPVQNPQRDEHGYPIKSPKTLLHEWCQKNKKPQPKFKAVSDSILLCLNCVELLGSIAACIATLLVLSRSLKLKGGPDHAVTCLCPMSHIGERLGWISIFCSRAC